MDQYGAAGYGDQVRRTDEYGNPVHHTGANTGGPTGVTHINPTGEHGARAFDHDKKEHGHGGGVLHRSNSSSSSSSEDDGQGGRKKKLKDRLKDKLPGGKKDHQTTTQDPYAHGTTATHGATTQGGIFGHGTTGTHEGGAYGHGTTGTHEGGAYGHGTTGTHEGGGFGHGTTGTHGANTTQGAYGHGTEEQPEKKGFMEKIKEKLPGHQGSGATGTHEGGAYGHGTTGTHEGGAYGHGTTGTHEGGAYDHGTTGTHEGGGFGHGTTGTHGANTTQGAYGHGAEEQPEKKGFMEKIKEKLPGHH